MSRGCEELLPIDRCSEQRSSPEDIDHNLVLVSLSAKVLCRQFRVRIDVARCERMGSNLMSTYCCNFQAFRIVHKKLWQVLVLDPIFVTAINIYVSILTTLSPRKLDQ